MSTDVVAYDIGNKVAFALTRASASQLSVEHWHERVGDATFGDAILDRLVHHAHRITLSGGSMRRIALANGGRSLASSEVRISRGSWHA